MKREATKVLTRLLKRIKSARDDIEIFTESTSDVSGENLITLDYTIEDLNNAIEKLEEVLSN